MRCSVVAPSPNTDATRSAATMSPAVPFPATTVYPSSGPTAAPVLDSRVQGVVVQATSESPASVSRPSRSRSAAAASPSSVSGKRT